MNNTTNVERLFRIIILLLFSSAILVLQSCSDDDPEPENEEELITTLTMTFVNIEDNTDVVIAQFKDVDGDGGMDPEYIHPTLTNGATYDAEIVLLNESVSPPQNISEEVEEEGVEHQFFFASSNSTLLSFGYLDSDENGDPIGLSTRWEVNEAGEATFRVTLRHMPNKDAEGVSDGDMTNAGGETDIEVDFDLIAE